MKSSKLPTFTLFYPLVENGNNNNNDNIQQLLLSFHDKNGTRLLLINQSSTYTEPVLNITIYSFEFFPQKLFNVNLDLKIIKNNQIIYQNEIYLAQIKPVIYLYPEKRNQSNLIFGYLSYISFSSFIINSDLFFNKFNTLSQSINFPINFREVIISLDNFLNKIDSMKKNFAPLIKQGEKEIGGFDYLIFCLFILLSKLINFNTLTTLSVDDTNLLNQNKTFTSTLIEMIFSINRSLFKKISNQQYLAVIKSNISLIIYIEIIQGKCEMIHKIFNEKQILISSNFIDDFKIFEEITYHLSSKIYPQINSASFNNLKSFMLSCVLRSIKKNDINKLQRVIRSISNTASCKEDIFNLIHDLTEIKYMNMQFYIDLQQYLIHNKWNLKTKENYAKYISMNREIFFINQDYLYDIDKGLLYFITLIRMTPKNMINLNYIADRAPLIEVKLPSEIIEFVKESNSLDINIRDLLRKAFYIQFTNALSIIPFPLSVENHLALSELFHYLNYYDFYTLIFVYLKNNNMVCNDLRLIFCEFFSQIASYMKNNQIQYCIEQVFKMLIEIYPRSKDNFVECVKEIYPRIVRYNTNNKLFNDKFFASFFEKLFPNIPLDVYSNGIAMAICDPKLTDCSFLNPVLTHIATISPSTFEAANFLINQIVFGNKIICDCKNYECILTKFIEGNVSQISIEDNLIYRIVEEPNKNDFWFIYITAEGRYLSFMDLPYIIKLKEEINKFYEKFINGDITYHDCKIISEYSKEKLLIFTEYFAFVLRADVNSILVNVESMIHEFREKTKQLTTVLNIADKFNYFFEQTAKNYFTEISNYYYKSNLQNEKLKNITVSKEIIDLYTNFEKISFWADTIIFREIVNLKLLNSSLLYKEGKFTIPLFTEFMNQVVEQCRALLSYVNNCDKKKIKFQSQLINLYKNLTDTIDESNKINTALQSQKLPETNKFMNLFKFEPSLKNNTNILLLLTAISQFWKYYSFVLNLKNLNQGLLLNDSGIELYSQFLSFKKNNDDILDYNTLDSLNNEIKGFIKNTFSLGADSLDLVTSFLQIYVKNLDLIKFIMKTPENEISSMIDLIDDQGDSLLSVTIITNLISIKSFLTKENFSLISSEKEFLKRVEHASSSLNSVIDLISPCGELYSSIIGLYQELSNKAEASKLKIKEIIYSSLINVNKTSINIKCSSKKKIEYKDIIELKERCLLFSSAKNAMIDVKANEIFVLIVNEIIDIKNILDSLYSDGYPDANYQDIVISNGDYSQLKKFTNRMRNVLNEWNKTIEEAYRRYYPLTLYNGKQIWELEKVIEEKK